MLCFLEENGFLCPVLQQLATFAWDSKGKVDFSTRLLGVCSGVMDSLGHGQSPGRQHGVLQSAAQNSSGGRRVAKDLWACSRQEGTHLPMGLAPGGGPLAVCE